MIDISELEDIAKARIKDADALLKARRYDGAIYLCGYAVEIALKARICKTLGWPGYPSSGREFTKYQSFRTHDLDVLLSLSGSEQDVKANLFAEWSAVAEWDPEIRYKPVGSATKKATELMIESSRRLVSAL